MKEALLSARIQAEAILAYYGEFRPEIVFPLMDLTVECEALGAKVKYAEDEAPSIEAPPLRGPGDLTPLHRPEVGLGNRLGVFADALAWARRHLPPGAALAAYIIGPFTMVGRLTGLSEIAIPLVLRPEAVRRLLSFCREVLSVYLRALDPVPIWSGCSIPRPA